MNEFNKYIRDYLKDHPEEQLFYWANYPPHKDRGPTYWIGTNIINKRICKHCLHESVETLTTGERGFVFEIEIEE